MPEIPDLEAIRGFLNERVLNVEITEAQAYIPHVVRTGATDFGAALTGNRFGTILRHGKFLLFPLVNDDYVMVINAMLTGRFQYLEPKAKKVAKTCFVLTFANGMQLRYADQLLMGKIYVVPQDQVANVPMFAEMGPDALAIGEDEFRDRIKKHTGAVKNILTNHRFIAGVGNAYSDEVLFEARIQPFRKRNTLSDGEIGDLYRGLRKTFDRSIPILRDHFKDELDYKEWREHLKVHRKGAPPGADKHVADKDVGRCPRCGSYLTELSPNQRVTTYCRTCQR